MGPMDLSDCVCTCSNHEDLPPLYSLEDMGGRYFRKSYLEESSCGRTHEIDCGFWRLHNWLNADFRYDFYQIYPENQHLLKCEGCPDAPYFDYWDSTAEELLELAKDHSLNWCRIEGAVEDALNSAGDRLPKRSTETPKEVLLAKLKELKESKVRK